MSAKRRLEVPSGLIKSRTWNLHAGKAVKIATFESYFREPADQVLLHNCRQVHRGLYTSRFTSSSLAEALLGPAMGNAQSSAIFDAASKDDLTRLQEIVRREHIDLGSSDKV